MRCNLFCRLNKPIYILEIYKLNEPSVFGKHYTVKIEPPFTYKQIHSTGKTIIFYFVHNTVFHNKIKYNYIYDSLNISLAADPIVLLQTCILWPIMDMYTHE